MTKLEQVNQLTRLWRVALPHIAEPSPQDAIRWCLYPMETVESAILQAGKRFTVTKLTADFVPTQAYKYVTATARSMTQRAAVAATSQGIALDSTELT